MDASRKLIEQAEIKLSKLYKRKDEIRSQIDNMGNLMDTPIIRLQMAGQLAHIDRQIDIALNNRYTHVCILQAMEAASSNKNDKDDEPMTAEELHSQAVYFTAAG